MHNRRIERLWRDVFDGMLYIYYHLEDSHSIDMTNEIHLFALHFVYIPRINNHLNVYVRRHIWTAGNHTPMQLYVLGLLRMCGNS